MNILGPHKKILILLGVCVSGLAFLHYLMFIDIKNRNENISILENDLSSQANKEEVIASLQAMLKNSASDITRLNSSFIGKDGDVQFIEDLEDLARSSGLEIEIDSLGFQNDASLGSSTMTFFNIKAKTYGSWTGTYLFFGQLESMPIKVKVSRLSLINTTISGDVDKQKISTQGNNWQGNFEISVLKNK